MINNKQYAFKVIPKYNLNTIGRLNSLINEPIILKRLKNNYNFVPNLFSYFQDYENIYIITTFFDGPSLTELAFFNLSENHIKFISACLIISLKYIRINHIIHRDLCIKNIIMDKDYYFNLIDFSSSVDYSKRNNKDFKFDFKDRSVPPEILYNSEEIDYNSDYYRLGLLIFFLAFKKYPWEYKKYANKAEFNTLVNINGKYSIDLLNFLDGLLKIDIKERLGYISIYELINHPWFKGFDWQKLNKKKLISPFKGLKIIRNNNVCGKFEQIEERIKNYIKLLKLPTFRKIIKFFDNLN